ncbi:MAG TPA: discoidin domain-containing protein [Lacisediminihabitans sp.]|uniref:discoidin domain-containing protein n=1 Tax=Lacisediminihabitans sp. TaxID=2787631 RepID=UPI002ED7A614
MLLATAMAASLVGLLAPAGAAHADGTLLSQGKTATASSTENGGTAAALAVDGNAGTRWSSAASDPQWLQVDLGASATISQVTLNWEAAYGKSFQIQTSPDGTTWTPIYTTTTGTGGTQNLTVSGTGRYVRMYGTVRGTQYGYSLWEFQVYGSATTGGTGGCSTTNAAQGKAATASSTENAGTPAASAVDGNAGTRWSSAASDPQWLQVDLGSSQTICGVTLTWEAAYGKSFQIQTSPDGTNWTPIYTTTTGTGGVQNLTVSGTGRYVRMYGTVRGTGYGYSLWEFGVFTSGSGGGSTGPTIPTSDTPDFGPNVAIFDPSMSAATIQAKLDEVFTAQKLNQFGTRRDALLFKPGTYSAEANIGYYTSIAGLGQNPDDVTINGDVTVDAFDGTGNATQNFWRSAENLAINPSAGTDRWAVAQAAPFRRIDVHGGLNLFPASYGWASGGYIADTKVTGQVASASQQQFYSRDSSFGSWNGSNWNMVFSGVSGAPAQSFPSPAITTLATTPVSRDKPYLYIDASGKYRVFEPSLRTNASGVSWANGSTPGTSVPMSTFYVAKPGDSTATLNAALDQGYNLFLTPGVYHLSETLRVTHANTVVLGIGFPTLIPDNGVNAMTVSDVDGVRLAGMLFDAGTVNSPVLLTVGATGSTASHASNPTTIQDVFFRIGGAGAGSATDSLVVNSNDTVIDHIWAWRADHGAGVGWTTNPAETGLIVNGNNVEATGLFVEHYQKYEVLWNGQNGKTIFFQNEMPYDVPDQASWMNGTTNGYAAYKVAANVTTHEAWGLGSYCYFNVNPSVNATRGFEVPDTPGVKLHDILTVSLGGNGTISHIVNNTGPVAGGTATIPVDLVAYP